MVQGGPEPAENTMVDLMVLAAVVFLFGLVSRRLDGTVLTAPLVFVAAGVILGPTGLGLVEFGLDEHAVLLLGEIALAIVLFTDAAGINLSALRQNEGVPLRLLGIGMPLTIALGTIIAALVLTDLAFWEAAIVGTVLAPTDAALGQAVVSNPRVPVRVRQALNVEAGLNDGLSVPFLMLFLSLAVAEEELQPASYWIRFALEQVGLGILVGVGVGLVGGWLVNWASKREWMSGSFRRLALLALAIIAWALADQIGGNGFIAAFVGGLAVGPTVESVGEQLIRFTEAEGQLLNLSVFFIFGVLVVGLIQPLSWEVAVYALLSLTVIRMLPVALSLMGTHLRGVSVLYMGWFGPRGARIDSAGSGRGGGGSAARRARRDGGGSGADGAAQRAVARGKCCPALGCVRPPGRRDARQRAGEEKNGRAADSCGLCVNQ